MGLLLGLINVIGAGPVGLHCAALLAEQGFPASVFEEHSTVGRPVQCAGLISKSGVEGLGIKLQNSLLNEIKGARIFSPWGESLSIGGSETVAFVVDRYEFDQLFLRRAKNLGCEVKTDSKLIDVRPSGKEGRGENSLFMQSSGHGELLRSKITVGADGPNSIVRHSVFPGLFEKDFVQAFQIRAEGKFDSKFAEMHFGKFAPGFFAWIVPESKSIARIGLAARQGNNAADCLEEFLREKSIDAKPLSKSGALIPISQPAKQLVSGNVLLVGDAASHTKATTGGGLVFGLKAASVCAETIAGHLKHHKPLSDYNKNLQEINRELSIHWRIYSYLHSMKPEQLDILFRKAKAAGIEAFLSQHGDMDRPSSFMRKMLFKPKMWGLLPAALRFA